MTISSDVAKLARSHDRLRNVCERLVSKYVANPDTDTEFIVCITPEQAHELSKSARKKCPIWSAWDEARASLREAEKVPS